MTDQELIALYEARSEEAIAATQRQYGAYCRTIAFNILADHEDTEECLSDLWLRVWNAIPPQRPDYFKGWLGTVARNCALTRCRQRGRQPEQVGEAALNLARDLSDGPGERMEAQALGEAISRFLLTRPQPERTAFLRRYWYGDPVGEVARCMGWTLARTKTTLFRTRQRLRAFLEKEEFL